MTGLPTGTVTFLFTDIEGSTRLLQQLKDTYAGVLAECRRLLRAAVQERGGQEVDTQGDAVFVAFPSAREALLAAVTAQQRILRQLWPDGAAVRVRMGLHTGEARLAEAGYVGIDVHRAARICAAAHGGQILLSDTTSALVTRDLPGSLSLRDLGEYQLKDLIHPHRLFQVVTADLPSEFPPVRSLDVVPHNLPRQLTSFIGREKEMAVVKRLLSTAHLVTLTGSGGAGKTRLALQVAADVAEAYPSGVWLVEFAPIADPSLVPKTVASALNVPEQPGRDMAETLVDALRQKALLLMLDNCEHLLAACADLAAALLRACPEVRILATSREGLGVPGETLWRIPSLSLPDPRSLPPLEDLVLYEAVRLFADRAVAIAPEFTITRENAPAVAQVCQRLDGIPLAIELAAARVRVLAVEQIATRLDDRFRLLTGGSRRALPRHQTLRGAIDWSYHLLSEPERALLRRVSVFAGGWTLEAAESVCAGEQLEAVDVLDRLTSLVDKSLVLAETKRGEARYRLLETVRQYGWDRLLESSEADAARTRHRDFFLRLAEEAHPYSLRGEQEWLDRLEREHDNLRAALDWSREAGHGHRLAGLRMAGALGPFWEVRGYLTEGRERLRSVLSGSQDLGATTERGKALTMAGRLAFFQGDYGAARPLMEESVAVCRRLGDKPGLALALNNLGPLLLNDGDYAAARSLYEEGGAIRREIGDKRGMAVALSNLGLTARCQGEYERARTFLEQSLGLFEELGENSGRAYSLTHLGVTEYCAGDATRAGALLKESLALFGKQGNKRLVAEALIMLAGVERVQGYPQRAAALFGAAQALYDATGSSVWTVNRLWYERDLAATRTQLGRDAFESAWAEGRAMTLEEAIEYALTACGSDAARVSRS